MTVEQEILFNRELHEQSLSRAVLWQRPHSIWKDFSHRLPRIQFIKRFW